MREIIPYFVVVRFRNPKMTVRRVCPSYLSAQLLVEEVFARYPSELPLEVRFIQCDSK